jgi:hypothetical protein
MNDDICKCCGQAIPKKPEEISSPLFTIVRHKKIGFQSRLAPEQLKYWETINSVFTSAMGIAKYFSATNDFVFECRLIGESRDIRNSETIKL